MTDFEKKIKTKLIEDEYAEKFHRLDTEESIAHITRDYQQLCKINEKRVQLEAEMEVEKNFFEILRLEDITMNKTNTTNSTIYD